MKNLFRASRIPPTKSGDELKQGKRPPFEVRPLADPAPSQAGRTLFLFANWKANKTLSEAEEWIKGISNIKTPSSNNLEIIVCPPFTLLYSLKSAISQLPFVIKLGAQDISPFPDGAYTGEVTGRMLKDLGVGYVLIGHSERRRYFGEDSLKVAQKVRMALDFGIIPVVCCVDLEQFREITNKLEVEDLAKTFFLFEPPGAISAQTGPIGIGQAEEISEVVEFIKKMKELSPSSHFLYGGSVKSSNIAEFISQEVISGVVVGSASLNTSEFIKMINASTSLSMNHE
jgi:triosephosphate isomerase